MLDFLDILGLMVMVLLRFGIPLGVMAVAAYFLKRLDARWEAEARASEEAARAAEQPAATQQPAVPARPAQPAATRQRRAPAPGPLPTFVPPPPARPIYQQPGLMMARRSPAGTSRVARRRRRRPARRQPTRMCHAGRPGWTQRARSPTGASGVTSSSATP